MDAIRGSLPPNPRSKANFLSILTFWWTIDLFRTGYRKTLELGDLSKPLDKDHSVVLGDELEKNWNKQLRDSPKSPSLIKAVLRTFWKKLILLGALLTMNETAKVLQPLLLGQLLRFFAKDNDPQEGLTKNDAWLAAGGIVALNLFTTLNNNQFMIESFAMGMRIRVAMCSLIYRKATRLSQTALGDTAPGKVVNLLSNDVNRFDLVSVLVNYMWTAPLFSLIIAYLLYREVGYPGLIGMAVVFLVVPLQSFSGKLSAKFRSLTALRTDARVRFMDEIISGIQVIKMYAWEKPFSQLICLARKLELKEVTKNSYLRGIYMAFLLFTTRMAMFTTLMTLALTDREITAARVFVVSAYLNIISQTMTQMFVRGVAEISEVSVALRRLRGFMVYEEKGEELNSTRVKQDRKSDKDDVDTNLMVIAKNATARWATNDPHEVKDAEKNPGSAQSINYSHHTLENVNFSCKKGSLVGVVGAVGAGKSSLLLTILRELPLESGEMIVNGSVSYACQEPWIFAASIRQNILFGADYEKAHYDKVVRACNLLADFRQFPDGDKTVIGERGSSLSGGQKARVSLARAMYRTADIYLLDDPLSAVDAHVGKHLFEECIGPKNKLCRHQTRILVTHQVHFLKDADWIIVLKDGAVQVQGTPRDLFNSDGDMELFLGGLGEVEGSEIDGGHLNESNKSSRRSSSSRRQSAIEELIISKEDTNVGAHMNLEQSSKGSVEGSLFLRYLRSGGNVWTVSFVIFLFVVTQTIASSFDWFVSFWTRQEELRAAQNATTTTTIKEINDIANDGPVLSTNACLYIHGGLILSLFIVGICRSFAFVSICMRASANLHSAMFQSLVSAKMRFFDTNPSGRILNRFSKDCGAVDEWLPKVILDSMQMVLSIFGVVIVALIIDYLFIIPMVVLGIAFTYVRRVYLKTSKNIKRLDGITRSPVFTHLNATLMGLSTVRVFDAAPILIHEFDALQDIHTATWFMFLSTTSAFGFLLDIMAVCFIAFVTFSFLALPRDAMGDSVGLIITQVLSLTTTIQWGIRQTAEVANHLMSVERMLEYTQLEKEAEPVKPVSVNKDWPSTGKITLNNVVYRYYPEAEPVLKGVNLVVESKEKIGIVGRTGAGKSSLIGAIFRLACVEGEIHLDGVETSSISLELLRSKVSIIPQDPVLFSGTLRRNLDPFEEYKDDALWNALACVQLSDIAGVGGLQTEVLANGSNFSVGQRQLICLARAILRDNKFLVLDEATANVDPETDSLIQETIREKFAECTVLTIAHRLHTIMDSDKVLVMDQGVVRQFDPPHVLLQDDLGIFAGMVQATGAQESNRLREIAKNTYESKAKHA